ncbi:hypothetical protein AB0L88_33220 [Saccharopolyspora shandongensis]|uniref:hypothetical protein n=1 Tax=Saccharopolyspora shandongensis TaxID=418495 RepID=UPI003433F0A0
MTGSDDVPGDVDGAVRALSNADPHSFYDAAQRFDRTAARLRSASGQFRGRLRHLEQVWQGPGFEVFSQSADRLLNRIEQVVGVLAEPSYAGLLNELGDALAEAKREIGDVRSQQAGDGAAAAPGVRAEQDGRAQDVLHRLANTYQSTGRRFRAPPARQASAPGGSVHATAAGFHGSAGASGSDSADTGLAGSGGGVSATEANQSSMEGGGDSGVTSGAVSSADGLSAVGEQGESSAGSIWSSVLPTAALPAAAVLGRNMRKRDEKKDGRRKSSGDGSEESRKSTEEGDDQNRLSSYRAEESEPDGAEQSGNEDRDARSSASDRRVQTEKSTSGNYAEPREQRESAHDGIDRRVGTVPPDRTDATTAQPPAVQPANAHSPAASGAAAAALGTSRFLSGSATAPPPPPPTGLRSDGGSLTAPVDTGSGPTGQPSTGSAPQGAGGPQSGMPPMNPRTMGGAGQKEQQESGHQERERNVAEHEDPSTWQVGAGSAGALGRAHPERGKEDPR